jgi:hypothetical protein
MGFAVLKPILQLVRRAVDGVPEPFISEGKVVRDDEGRPLSIQRYSDALLIELLRMSHTRNSPGELFLKPRSLPNEAGVSFFSDRSLRAGRR